ncbi:Transposase IS3/IS911 [hydrothermal vent metagenome]|uniref:Transposase IS3/IS911 n=1 Tax=hydrothermal vent metagenome TaxID=652676 RepID=A0A3B0ZIK4_9ZZZZ
MRRKFSAGFKAKVAIEALKERSTLAELSKKHELHVNQITQWKREFIDNSNLAFGGDKTGKDVEAERDLLLRKVGELQMDNDFLKKNLERTGR